MLRRRSLWLWWLAFGLAFLGACHRAPAAAPTAMPSPPQASLASPTLPPPTLVLPTATPNLQQNTPFDQPRYTLQQTFPRVAQDEQGEPITLTLGLPGATVEVTDQALVVAGVTFPYRWDPPLLYVDMRPGVTVAFQVEAGQDTLTLRYADTGDVAAVLAPWSSTAAEITPAAQAPTPTLPPSPTPAPYPTPTPQIYCASFPSHLHTGMVAYVSPFPPQSNNVRTGPGKQYSIIGLIDPNELVYVAEGPVCADHFTWWRVTSYRDGLTGWTVEGDANAYWLLPCTPDQCGVEQPVLAP